MRNKANTRLPKHMGDSSPVRKPGQTYDDVINELIRKNSENLLIEETKRIRKRNKYVSLSELEA